MGGKARQVFQVVLWGAAVYATGGALGPYAAYALSAASTVYGAYVARDARKKAERASKGGQDRRITLRGGAIAKSYVYGNQWVPGVIVGHRSPVSKEDPYFWLVLALPIAHEISAYKQIRFGDIELWPLALNGDVSASRYNRIYRETHTQQGFVPSSKLIDLRPKPGHTGEAIRVLGEMDGEQFVCSVALTENFEMPVMTTGDNTWQDRRHTPREVSVSRVPGVGTGAYNDTVVLLNGAETDEEYTITYKYQYSRSYIKVWAYRGSENQVANPDFVYATRDSGIFETQWTTSDRLRGIPHVVFRFHVEPELFPNGLEPISFHIAGKNNIVYPDGSRRYSENPALCIRDYLVSVFKADPAEIDDTGHFVSQVLIADETIAMPPWQGGSQPRYRIDLSLSTETTPIDNLGEMLTTCDGAVVPSGAYLDIWVGHFPLPEIVLDDSDFMTHPEVVKGMSRPELFNSVRARHPNSRKDFWPVEMAPPYPSRFYAIQDNFGQEPPLFIWREIDLMGIRDPWMAHRISKQFLFRARNGLRLTGVLSSRAIPLAPEMTFYYKIRSLGMAMKVFRVKKFKALPDGTVELEAQEDSPLLYEWNFDETSVDPTPNTILPDVRNVPTLEGLRAETNRQAAALGPNGQITAQCRVYWSEIKDPLVLAGGHVDIRYKRAHELNWNTSPKLPTTQEEYRFPIMRGDILVIEGRMSNRVVAGNWRMIKKIANDTPTAYLTGNLLANSRFIYRNQYIGASGIEYDYDGWVGPFGGGAIDMQPLRSVVGAGTGTDPNNPGVVYWFENDPAVLAPAVTWEESHRVGVVPGERMVFYCYGHSRYTNLRMDILWCGSDGKPLKDASGAEIRGRSPLLMYAGSDPKQGDIIAHSIVAFRTFGNFAIVPPGSVTALVVLISFRAAWVPSDRKATPAFFRPYFGRASAGQIVFPPWSA